LTAARHFELGISTEVSEQHDAIQTFSHRDSSNWTVTEGM
jgi:hypothetical protein